jgi:hypothetical protein
MRSSRCVVATPAAESGSSGADPAGRHQRSLHQEGRVAPGRRGRERREAHALHTILIMTSRFSRRPRSADRCSSFAISIHSAPRARLAHGHPSAFATPSRWASSTLSRATEQVGTLIVADARLAPAPGGPLVDAEGRLVGINSMVSTVSESPRRRRWSSDSWSAHSLSGQRNTRARR